MGLFDEIRWDAALPADHPPDSRLFQTKSFDSCMDRYVVTPEGRLQLVGSGWQFEDKFEDTERSPVEVEFHGDIRMLAVKGDQEYMVRFTHGTLEWIRPLGKDEPWTTLGAAHVKWATQSLKSKPPDDPAIIGSVTVT